ncbi:DUF2460 domain-containing protein [Pseudoblastomonas halimionae]|uniref:TIGR02217 family protein n=1 Tax=Alteriqipengyuania halimionae TaxID=1926630 RepID=A0A6I4U9S0_9SPHN|nr:DUF2460 domain-containing protein [Alteriqipengyuania halimionae]MXP11017.1 TIGR02217 family protein [Alteriqipengyuania halimionae]
MSHYLATKREGQATDWIARFDPRFWTVNFPRPMLACIVTPAPDTLRVEATFRREGDLAGIVWASEDTIDHPLLAYDTARDYAYSTLSFRWRSGGVIALDGRNGPTLTIEGRDAAGQPRSWFVRLWNYASGSPEDAQVALPFSQLAGGWDGDDLVYPHDIDRMFVSLVPPDYLEGSETPLAAPADGWAEMSGIAVDGAHACLRIGDVHLPPHDTGCATGYDDAAGQAPARLVRQIEALGYRGKVIHYVGMSHYPRLAHDGSRFLAGDVAEPVAGPAQSWHREYFEALRAAGLTPIVSLSYELLDDYCPVAWRQRSYYGSPALTGWDPPSTLLRPTSEPAMGWLQSVAARFVALIEGAGHPVHFQIGEPWWWVMPDGTPCFYDDWIKANAVPFAPHIPDMTIPLYPNHRDFLDWLGTLLADSTAALAQAVRDAADGPAELSLLVFTPTVLDPAMPELKRCNLPTGWAWPAFDRLQLEDYDWLTARADGLRRKGYAEVDARLGYPLDRQDYLSGFVLREENAEAQWPRIDAALDQAAARGVPNRFVWALPQIARDGFVRLPLSEDPDMRAFDDVPYPLSLGRDAAVSPEFSTSIAVTASGHERRNALWSDARLRFDVGPGIRSEDELGGLLAFYRARRGPARGFRLRDPSDFSSRGMTGEPSPTDQRLGTGDGLTTDFALVKHYGDPADEPQTRRITRPDPTSLRVSLDGVEVASGWSLADGGRIVFESAPEDGVTLAAGFLFDVPVRFSEDRLDFSGAAFKAGEAPSVPLVEIREAA